MDIHNKLVSQTYSAARSAAAPMPGTTEPAANPVASSVSAFEEVLASAEQTARAAMMGGADPHALVEALAASEMAVDTVVTVRDKVVEAYQEILRMPV